MSVPVSYPRPATPRGGPWSPAVRRLLHERGIDPARFDIGPHRLTLRILTALLNTPAGTPAAAEPAAATVDQAAAEVPDVPPQQLAALLGAAVVRAWSQVVTGALPRLVIEVGGRTHAVRPTADAGDFAAALDAAPGMTGQPSGTGPVLRVVAGTVRGVRTAPATAPGEIVLAAGVPALDVVPVRLADGEPALGWRTRVPLTLVAPPDLGGAALLRAVADQLDSDTTR